MVNIGILKLLHKINDSFIIFYVKKMICVSNQKTLAYVLKFKNLFYVLEKYLNKAINTCLNNQGS